MYLKVVLLVAVCGALVAGRNIPEETTKGLLEHADELENESGSRVEPGPTSSKPKRAVGEKEAGAVGKLEGATEADKPVDVVGSTTEAGANAVEGDKAAVTEKALEGSEDKAAKSTAKGSQVSGASTAKPVKAAARSIGKPDVAPGAPKRYADAADNNRSAFCPCG